MEKVYFLVTDRKSLDKGHVSVNPMPIVDKGQTEFLGDCVLPIKDCVAEVIDDGSKAKHATLLSLRRKDGVIELNEKVISRIVEVGIEAGFVVTD